jgi:hypothetical protein
MNDKNSFVLYTNFHTQFAMLPAEDRGDLILAIFEYEESGEVQTPLAPLPALAFSFIKDTLDRDRAAYEERCERNRENGKKGGRPKKNDSPAKTKSFSEKPKKPYNDNDNDNDIDNDIDIDGGEKDCGAVPKESVSEPPLLSLFAPLTPMLSEREKQELKERGVPLDYVTLRLERARAYAKKHRISVSVVLWEWWQQDQHSRRAPTAARSQSPVSPEQSNKSYDLDDFWQAAVERSYALLGEAME